MVMWQEVHQGEVGPVDPGAPPLPTGAADVVRFFMEVPQPIQIGGVVLGGVLALLVLALAWRHRLAVRIWIASLPLAIKVATVVLVAVVGGAASVAGYRVYDYVEHDNSFCTGCHVMTDAFVRFEESPHNELGCKACHAQAKTESARQLYLWVVDRPMEVGPHSPVPDARCTSCHVDQDEGEWPQIARSLGHRVHLDSDDPDLSDVMCVTCHGVSVHEFAPAAATCGDCHEAQADIRLGRMAGETGLHCVACHNFLGEEPTQLPGAPEGIAMLPDGARCLSCHQMGDMLNEEELEGEPHGAVCGACHNPHSQTTPQEAGETCVGCHENAESITEFHTGTHAPALVNCLSCHRAHSWEVDGNDCVSCHGAIPDEGAEVAREAGPSFLGPSWARLAIHRGGGGGGAPAAAVTEPAFPAVEMDPAFPRISGVLGPRPFRHAAHQEVTCVRCHGREGEHGVVTVHTPQDCASCHHDPDEGYSCATCHGEADIPLQRQVTAAMDLTVWKEPRMRELEFRHALHEEMTCQECHSGGVLLGVQRECADCHVDHHRTESDCASCHLPTEPGVHGLESHLTCTNSGCHSGTAGERPTLSRSMCLACHGDEKDHEPGMSCHACHMVPEVVGLRVGEAGGVAA